MMAKDLKPNMVLAKDIFNDSGSLLLIKGVPLTELHINKLQSLNYGAYIVDDNKKNESIKKEDIIQMKNRTFNEVKKILTNIKGRKEINIKQIEEIATSILSDISRNPGIVRTIFDMNDFGSDLFSHSVNVSMLALIVGIEMKLPPKQLNWLFTAAMLHDCGKIFLDPEIVNKPDKDLTFVDIECLRNHPYIGKDTLEDLGISAQVYVPVYLHHEWYDGSGYPTMKKGEDIHLFARIIAVCNKYDDIINPKNMVINNVNEVIEAFMLSSGFELDPKIVKLFLDKLNPYCVGAKVKLSNGMIGTIKTTNKTSILRPIITVQLNGQSFDMDLSQKSFTNITIIEIQL
jgi:HD-GYP domain-containing protein (c-di-GMP phosphodiesterase class II)